MLHESANLSIATVDGVATLRLGGPTLPELANAIRVVASTPGLELLVLRGWFAPPWYGDPLGYAITGQRLTRAIADLPLVTVAFVEGMCQGPALELALACDHRLAVAGPDSWIGFPDATPCWGGTARLPLGLSLRRPITAREAVRAQVLDDACSARRGSVELQLLLDRQLRRPRKRRQPFNLAECEATERRTAAVPASRLSSGWEPLPASVGLVGDGLGAVAGELAARGVAVCGDIGGAERLLADGLRRGRWTPLEHDQSARRLTTADPHTTDWTISTVGQVAARPGRLLTLPAATIPGWLRRAGVVANPGVRSLFGLYADAA